jgi:UDP-glucose 6-dehydrogenase
VAGVSFWSINPEFLAEGTAIEDLFNADEVADWWETN